MKIAITIMVAGSALFVSASPAPQRGRLPFRVPTISVKTDTEKHHSEIYEPIPNWGASIPDPYPTDPVEMARLPAQFQNSFNPYRRVVAKPTPVGELYDAAATATAPTLANKTVLAIPTSTPQAVDSTAIVIAVQGTDGAVIVVPTRTSVSLSLTTKTAELSTKHDGERWDGTATPTSTVEVETWW